MQRFVDQKEQLELECHQAKLRTSFRALERTTESYELKVSELKQKCRLFFLLFYMVPP